LLQYPKTKSNEFYHIPAIAGYFIIQLVAWMRANKLAFDTFAVVWSRHDWAALGWACASAARAFRWANEWWWAWHGNIHGFLLLLVWRADWAVHTFATFWPRRFWASLGYFFACAARASGRAVRRDGDGH